MDLTLFFVGKCHHFDRFLSSFLESIIAKTNNFNAIMFAWLDSSRFKQYEWPGLGNIITELCSTSFWMH